MCTFLFCFLREGKCDALWVPKDFDLTFISFVENRSLWIDLIKASSAKFPAWSNCFKQWMKVFQYPSPFFIPVPQNPFFFLLSDVHSLLFFKNCQVGQWDCDYFCFVLNPVYSFSCQIDKQRNEDGQELAPNFVGAF